MRTPTVKPDPIADLFAELKTPRTVLLDLNSTLVANALEKKPALLKMSMERWIRDLERYRTRLVQAFRDVDHDVIMITARPTRFEVETMDRIKAQTGGWLPDDWHFNCTGEPPPMWKRRVMVERVFPKVGREPAKPFLALESNPQTRAMYRELPVPVRFVPRAVT